MEYIAIRLHGGAALSGGAARLLVAYALHRRGRDWAFTSVDAFSGGLGGETLLIARPAAVEARFADYFLPVLAKYFTK